MNTEAVLPREPFCTTSSPGTVRRTCSTVSACRFSISLAVRTVAEVVTWESGVSVRVEVTNTGGKVASGGSAARNGAAGQTHKSKMRQKTFMKTSFTRERGMLWQRG